MLKRFSLSTLDPPLCICPHENGYNLYTVSVTMFQCAFHGYPVLLQKSYEEYLYTLYLKKTTWPDLQTGFCSPTALPNLKGSIPDAYRQSEDGRLTLI